MKSEMEHVNIYVSNIDKTVWFLATALPELRVRGEGSNGGVRWMHIGTESTYVAINETPEGVASPPGDKLNHIGYTVEDVAAVKERLASAGYKEGLVVTDPHPHRKRLYFLDADGLEWEFVQYLSERPEERNLYD